MEKFKRTFRSPWSIFLIAFFLVLLQACKKNSPEVIQLKFSHDFVVIDQGGCTSLDLVINPIDFDKNKIQWHSSNQSIATVQDGVVTALSDGDVDIMASYGDMIAYCHVKVVNIYKIEYSRFDDVPGNTIPHFQAALHNGFNGLKADMRLTLDNRIILCHDKGYTLNSDGRITTFDADNYIPIDSLTEQEVLNLEFDEMINGSFIHPCNLEDFLVLCKENFMIPYITLRHDDREKTTAEEMYRLLKKYNLENVAIVNLYPYRRNQVKKLKSLDPNMVICDTKLGSTDASIEWIDKMHEEGVGIVCYKYNTTVLTTLTDDIIQYASSHGVKIWSWNVENQEEYDYCVNRGINGFQVYSRTMW